MKLQLSSYFYQLRLVQTLFGQSLFSIHLGGCNLEGLLGIFPSSIGGSKLTIDFCKASIDELIGLASFLILFVVSALIIGFYQIIHIINTTKYIFVGEKDIEYVQHFL